MSRNLATLERWDGFELTELNRVTTLRFLACQHVPADKVVWRWYDGELRAVPVCAGCEVPLGPRQSWMGRRVA